MVRKRDVIRRPSKTKPAQFGIAAVLVGLGIIAGLVIWDETYECDLESDEVHSAITSAVWNMVRNQSVYGSINSKMEFYTMISFPKEMAVTTRIGNGIAKDQAWMEDDIKNYFVVSYINLKCGVVSKGAALVNSCGDIDLFGFTDNCVNISAENTQKEGG